jgi:hypothetical protein
MHNNGNNKQLFLAIEIVGKKEIRVVVVGKVSKLRCSLDGWGQSKRTTEGWQGGL